MHSQKIIIFLSISTRIVLAGDCGAFSVGECSPRKEDLVGVHHLPCEEIYHECVRACQRLCLITTNCDLFSYNVDSQVCTLVQESFENAYLSTCDVLAGPDTPTLLQCSETTPEDDCDRFITQDCVYLGKSVLNQTNVGSPSDCQGLLRDFGDMFSATYFVHDVSPKHFCQLKDKDKRTCSSVAGPQAPDYDHCKGGLALRNI